MKNQSADKGNYVIVKDTVSVYFFFLNWFKNNRIEQYVYNCIVGSITYRNEIKLTITAERSGW